MGRKSDLKRREKPWPLNRDSSLSGQGQVVDGQMSHVVPCGARDSARHRVTEDQDLRGGPIAGQITCEPCSALVAFLPGRG